MKSDFKNLKTKIFLDSGIPDETKQTLDRLGFLDGQTTNPSLVTKHPLFKDCQTEDGKCSAEDAWNIYKKIVSEVSSLIPEGSVSIEVYADQNTTAEEMTAKARELFDWIPNSHIKLPATTAGLTAAETLVKEGVRVNITLCFSQPQAAAVYAATQGAKPGQVFVSPFVGRLDDRGEDGMSLIENIIKMYETGDGHVEVLVASLRKLDHLHASFNLGADIVTIPFKLIEEWSDKDLSLPSENFQYDRQDLKPIPYQDLDLNADWQSLDLSHPLTDQGMEKFSEDWHKFVN